MGWKIGYKITRLGGKKMYTPDWWIPMYKFLLVGIVICLGKNILRQGRIWYRHIVIYGILRHTNVFKRTKVPTCVIDHRKSTPRTLRQTTSMQKWHIHFLLLQCRPINYTAIISTWSSIYFTIFIRTRKQIGGANYSKLLKLYHF